MNHETITDIKINLIRIMRIAFSEIQNGKLADISYIASHSIALLSGNSNDVKLGRSDFDLWLFDEELDMSENSDGSYKCSEVNKLWEYWKKSRGH
jgi:hypothetical protein